MNNDLVSETKAPVSNQKDEDPIPQEDANTNTNKNGISNANSGASANANVNINTNVNVNFSLSKKKKKKSKTKFILGDDDGDDEDGVNIATAAQVETERRLRDDVQLIIPLLDARNDNGDGGTGDDDEKDVDGDGKKSKQPLLQGLKDIVSGKSAPKINNKGNDYIENNKDVEDADADAKAEKALMEDANQHFENKDQAEGGTNFSARGSLVIQNANANKHESKKMDEKEPVIDDTLKYQRDLAHRAEDVSVTSSAYVSVPISEFGAAMLRGMGWSGNDKSKDKNDKKKKEEEEIAPRPHRLGLGATPLPPSMSSGRGGTYNGTNTGNGNGTSNGNATANGKRHRARKGGSMEDIARVTKDEEAERQWKLKLLEKKKRNVQVTQQVGSIVYVHDNYGDRDSRRVRRRAKLVKIAGVPGLNRILVQYEHEAAGATTSIKKREVSLVDPEALERSPFQKVRGQDKGQSYTKINENRNGNDRVDSERKSTTGNSRKRDDRSSAIDAKTSRRKSRSRSRDRNRDYDQSRDREKDRDMNIDRKRRRRERSRSRSRSRSDSRDRKRIDKDRYRESRQRKCSRSKDRDEERDRDRNRDRDCEHRDRDRNRSKDRDQRKERDRDRDTRKRSRQENDNDRHQGHDLSKSRRKRDDIDDSRNKSKREKGQGEYSSKPSSSNSEHRGSRREKAEQHWLVSNIRIRVVTKKIAKGRQFKQKGIVVDVLRKGSEATLQMSNGEILERIHERYLETALPKVGGNVIILTGSNKFEKGKLLERDSEKGRGVVQLFEDMHVKTLSLDDIAEYCGPLDDALADY